MGSCNPGCYRLVVVKRKGRIVISHAEAERLVAEEVQLRATAVKSYLTTISQLGQLIDRLGGLHTELASDDRLQQSLHALGFVWGYVESELRMAVSEKS